MLRGEISSTQLGGWHAGDAQGTIVHLIASGDLQELQRTLTVGTIADCGTKHRAKPLTTYLQKRSGIAAIRAGYTHAGQALRGVRALLNAVRARQAPAIYLVSVNAVLFQELWARASLPPRSPTPPAPAYAVNRMLDFLLKRNPDETMPATLREAYRGSSPAAEMVRRLILRAARGDQPILIQGPTGTGKEIVAYQIHARGARAAESFLTINCGGIPSELLESELFGHVKGAFTGALRDKKGLWTLASKGTLFLDEVGDLSLHHQVKILRALEAGVFRPVGSEEELHSNARVIAATNCDLAHMVATGRFREDLYYRLFAFRIRTPALREHLEDIPELAEHLWQHIAGAQAQPLPPAVVQALQAYEWPGNVRELRSFLANVFLLLDRRTVDLPLIRTVMQDRLGVMDTAGGDQ